MKLNGIPYLCDGPLSSQGQTYTRWCSGQAIRVILWQLGIIARSISISRNSSCYYCSRSSCGHGSRFFLLPAGKYREALQMDTRPYSPSTLFQCKDRTELWISMVSLTSAMPLVIVTGVNLHLFVE